MAQGILQKMQASCDTDGKVRYHLTFAGQTWLVNSFIGKKLQIEFSGKIQCLHCGREIKKSFNQGSCFPCFRRLACNDACQVKPETCHFSQGTCREPEWGNTHCMIRHIVYLADTSGVKVGITRHYNIPSRWLDQGAVSALPFAETSNRLDAGRIEVALKECVRDKTDWRRMLKGNGEGADLVALRAELATHLPTTINYQLSTEPVRVFHYPVTERPDKITAINLDKTPMFTGRLLGIKGQYLIFDRGVLNIRKFAGYALCLSLPTAGDA